MLRDWKGTTIENLSVNCPPHQTNVKIEYVETKQITKKILLYLALEDQSAVGWQGSPSVSWCWLKTSRRGCLCMVVVVSLCMVVMVRLCMVVVVSMSCLLLMVVVVICM